MSARMVSPTPAPISPPAELRRGSSEMRPPARPAPPPSRLPLRVVSQGPRFQLRRDVFRRPPRQRHDCPGGILVGLRREGSTIGHEDILDLVRLAVAIHD